MADLFFYGSLRERALIEIVLDRPVAPEDVIPATAEGYAAHAMIGEAYPALLPAPGRKAEGVVLRNASNVDIDRLCYFEEAEYGFAPIHVETALGGMDAVYFRGTDKVRVTDADWDFEHWQREERPAAMWGARELMGLFGTVPVEDIDDFWPGIMIRARQRARAATAEPALGKVRTGYGPADVEVVEMTRPYTSFLTVEEYKLRHRRFDGAWSGEVNRSVVLWGDAVTILPYDPIRDEVLLIEQFRPAPMARGDANPWCIEVVAGRIDQDETAEATARREAREEAGLEIGRIREIGQYYSTSGLAAEHMTSFVGEANLAGAGGLHGLAEEGEDIRSFVLSYDAAMEAIGDGAVNTAHAYAPLMWLAANRERLRLEWRR